VSLTARQMIDLSERLGHRGWIALPDRPAWRHPQLDFLLDISEVSEWQRALRLRVTTCESAVGVGVLMGVHHYVPTDGPDPVEELLRHSALCVRRLALAIVDRLERA
jgi:hypothetical protein